MKGKMTREQILTRQLKTIETKDLIAEGTIQILQQKQDSLRKQRIKVMDELMRFPANYEKCSSLSEKGSAKQ
jgi:hypothetical protein